VLASSLDYEKTLKQIARMIVDTFADLCVIDMVEPSDSVMRLTVAHSDASKANACEKLMRLSLTRRNTLARTALEVQNPQLFTDMTDEFLRATAAGPEHLSILYELGPPRSAIVAPLVTTNGVIGALVMSSLRPNQFQPRDVTLATELARRAAIAIENARLYEAAQRATKARDDALAIVAHDVRNPIATVHLAATTLEREIKRGAAPAPESVEIILRAAKRANRLIQDLLDISRIEGGALSLAREPMLPKQLASEAIEAQRLLASAADVTLDSRMSDDLRKSPAIATGCCSSSRT
jgi:signal transduction histidine kinase